MMAEPFTPEELNKIRDLENDPTPSNGGWGPTDRWLATIDVLIRAIDQAHLVLGMLDDYTHDWDEDTEGAQALAAFNGYYKRRLSNG